MKTLTNSLSSSLSPQTLTSSASSQNAALCRNTMYQANISNGQSGNTRNTGTSGTNTYQFSNPSQTFHASTFSKIITITRILIMANLRNWITLFFTFLFPAALLIFLILTIGNSVPSAIKVSVISAITSNIIVFCICYTGISMGGIVLSVWKSSGLLEVLKRMPISSGIIICAQFFCGIIFAICESALLICIGLAFKASFDWKLVIGLAPLVCGFLLFFGIGIILGLKISNTGAVSGIANAIILPLAFIGGLWSPLSQMPQWLQNLAPFTPLYQFGQSMLMPLTGLNLKFSTGTWADFWIGLAYIGIAAICFIIGAAKTFDWK